REDRRIGAVEALEERVGDAPDDRPVDAPAAAGRAPRVEARVIVDRRMIVLESEVVGGWAAHRQVEGPGGGEDRVAHALRVEPGAAHAREPAVLGVGRDAGWIPARALAVRGA